MTQIENSIDQDTAVQIDISEIIPSPIDDLKAAVKNLERDYRNVTKYQTQGNELRTAIADIRAQVAESITHGDDDKATALIRDLRTANNRLDKAIERATEAEINISGLKDDVLSTLGAL